MYKNYSSISKFGNMKNPSAVNNPLTYCINNTIDNKFLHGGPPHILADGQGSPNCQAFLSDYCAQGWDSYCEYASNNINERYPSTMETPDSCDNIPRGFNAAIPLTEGEVLLRNTASRKYLVKMIQGKELWEPFDPTVADSPMIRKWVQTGYGNPMSPVYAVNPREIDNDIVMNKILSKPRIAMDILMNIYHTMKRNGTINQLDGTNLGKFYNINKQYFF
jgi:hypothetical protein